MVAIARAFRRAAARDYGRGGTGEASVKRIVVVANRLPVSWTGDKWTTSPGGLVRALGPILQDAKGAWVGWPGIADFAPEPFEYGGIEQRPLALSEQEVAGFYYGFCNGTLWPLYHDALAPPAYHRRFWYPYRNVNDRYARAAAECLFTGDIAWVQDYQLQLVPGMLRTLRDDVTIGFYLHIPFPPIELFSRLPWRAQIIEGLLGADVLAFQTRASVANFAKAAQRYGDATPVSRYELRWRGRRIRLQRAPIAIDTPHFERLARSESVQRRAAQLRHELGNSSRIILGVDRLDYTKGIDLRLKAFASLLDRRGSEERYTFVQIAVPSREHVPVYQELRRTIEQLVGRVNGDHGEVGWVPVSYLYRRFDLEELIAYYVAADIMLVTPLRDGMNLVAKEYVASRCEPTGVLVLSEFAGAAEQLRTALIVNPHDVDGVAAALEAAIDMPAAEVESRMKRLIRTVRRETVFDWAEGCLALLDR